jgi:molybdate transport system substrate-binding protein
MRLRIAGWIVCCAALLSSCAKDQPPAKLTVAAAANLTDVFADVGKDFKAKSGLDVTFSYGPTTALAQQIENGAPFDLFASADTAHIDSLVASGKIVADTRAVYALGQLAMWVPKTDPASPRRLEDLARKEVRFVAVAQPELAPYGQATIETLQHAGLFDVVKPKIVYANSISQAKQLAESGNADAAFTAYSLVLHDRGTILKVDPGLYRPIEQALGVVASSAHLDQAKQFRSFLLGPEGRTILERSGYMLPLH